MESRLSSKQPDKGHNERTSRLTECCAVSLAFQCLVWPAPWINCWWNLSLNIFQTSSTGRHSVRITGLSTIDFRAGFSRKPTLDFKKTVSRPVQGLYLCISSIGTVDIEVQSTSQNVVLWFCSSSVKLGNMASLFEIRLHSCHSHCFLKYGPKTSDTELTWGAYQKLRFLGPASDVLNENLDSRSQFCCLVTKAHPTLLQLHEW